MGVCFQRELQLKTMLIIQSNYNEVRPWWSVNHYQHKFVIKQQTLELRTQFR